MSIDLEARECRLLTCVTPAHHAQRRLRNMADNAQSSSSEEALAEPSDSQSGEPRLALQRGRFVPTRVETPKRSSSSSWSSSPSLYPPQHRAELLSLAMCGRHALEAGTSIGSIGDKSGFLQPPLTRLLDGINWQPSALPLWPQATSTSPVFRFLLSPNFHNNAPSTTSYSSPSARWLPKSKRRRCSGVEGPRLSGERTAMCFEWLRKAISCKSTTATASSTRTPSWCMSRACACVRRSKPSKVRMVKASWPPCVTLLPAASRRCRK
mmetsp:Transcript_16155/g.56394  ORF Transcript_16155/g.56394 Transcript_16155/m.56394 type:complete len:267 (+) Transcript_16155:337-1137(+)